jgi:hypothetical protein
MDFFVTQNNKNKNCKSAGKITACKVFCKEYCFHISVGKVLCRLCYVHCRTQFYHVDIFLFPVSMLHVYFQFRGHLHSDILPERSSYLFLLAWLI